MKKIFYLTICLSISSVLWAQTPIWSTVFDSNHGVQFFGLTTTGVGIAATFGDQSDGWSQRIAFWNTNGNLLWVKDLGRPEHTFTFNNVARGESSVLPLTDVYN